MTLGVARRTREREPRLRLRPDDEAEAAGEVRVTVSFGHSVYCLILCEISQKKNVRGNAGERERG
jgi:hypothetical protein